MALALGGCDALERQAIGTVSDVQTEDGQVTGFFGGGGGLFRRGDNRLFFSTWMSRRGKLFWRGRRK